MMAGKKPSVSPAFRERIFKERPEPYEGPEAYLDWALPLYRSIQSAVENGEAQLAFLSPGIVDALEEVQKNGRAPEYVARSGRTMGMLVPSPKPIDKKLARSQAAKIRRIVGKEAVVFERKVAIKVNWDLIAKHGEETLTLAREIVGLRKPKLLVGKRTKRIGQGKERRRRGR